MAPGELVDVVGSHSSRIRRDDRATGARPCERGCLPLIESAEFRHVDQEREGGECRQVRDRDKEKRPAR